MSTTPNIPDLITLAYAKAYLDLSTTDAATKLPGAITAASRLVRNHTNRFLTQRPSGNLGPIEELITPPLRGWINLAEFPVNDILRVSSNKTTVLTVVNNDAVTNQRATCKLVRTGDSITGFTPTGIYLERWASGVKIPATILFTALGTPTIGALATAITALGNGWEATTTDYALWPVSELWSAQGSLGALQSNAEFEAWTDDVEIERDDAAGMIRLVNGSDNPFSSMKWGPTAGLDFGDQSIRGATQGLRVTYDAGYPTIPEDLQQAVVETTKAMLERKNISTVIASERTDSWTIVTREVIDAIPRAAAQTLALYRDHAR